MSGAGAEFVMPDELHLPPNVLALFGKCTGELEEEPARSTTYGLRPASL
jgi:hypothetical protein